MDVLQVFIMCLMTLTITYTSMAVLTDAKTDEAGPGGNDVDGLTSKLDTLCTGKQENLPESDLCALYLQVGGMEAGKFVLRPGAFHSLIQVVCSSTPSTATTDLCELFNIIIGLEKPPGSD